MALTRVLKPPWASSPVADPLGGDGRGDLVFAFSQGGKVTLLGVSDPASVQIDYSAGAGPGAISLGSDGLYAFEHIQATMPLV